MTVHIHAHARERMRERGATQSEVIETVLSGSSRPAKHGRVEYRKTFAFGGIWLGRYYTKKRVDAFAVNLRGGNTIVVTVVVKYF
jgi:hypothetical protein